MRAKKPFWETGDNPITMFRDVLYINFSVVTHNKSIVSFDKQITEYRKERYNQFKL